MIATLPKYESLNIWINEKLVLIDKQGVNSQDCYFVLHLITLASGLKETYEEPLSYNAVTGH